MALEAVREAFEIFINRIDDKEGITYLGIALDSAHEFIENRGSKQERDIIANLVRTYRNKVMEKVKKDIGNGTPDSEQLECLDRLMRRFADSDFANDSDFQALQAEVFSRWRDQMFVEFLGKRPSELTFTEKASLKALFLKNLSEEEQA